MRQAHVKYNAELTPASITYLCIFDLASSSLLSAPTPATPPTHITSSSSAIGCVNNDSHDPMASDNAAPTTARPNATVTDLVAFTKRELDADAERQSQVAAAGAGDLQGQTGATLDLSHKNIHTLPVEVIALIKDRVERLVNAADTET